MVNTSKFTFAKQVQEKAQELQEVAVEIVKRTVAEKGEVPECDCLEYNGELIDASMMLNNVTTILVGMSDALFRPYDGYDNSPSKKQKTETAVKNTPNANEEVATAPPALSRMPSVVANAPPTLSRMPSVMVSDGQPKLAVLGAEDAQEPPKLAVLGAEDGAPPEFISLGAVATA